HDLVIHPRDNDLVVATHGRGIFVLDDITPLERLASAARADIAFVFPPRDALIFNPRATPARFGHRNYSTPNPPAGVTVSYFVGPDAPTAVGALAVIDEGGAVVRELSAPIEPGVHRITWDLRHPPPTATGR